MTRIRCLAALLAILLFLLVNRPCGGGDLSSGEAGAAAADAAAQVRFLDINGDGAVDAGEFAAGQSAARVMATLRWEECDTDGDGAVSGAEYVAALVATADTVENSAIGSEADSEAEAALARALPVSVLLDRLAGEARYADEIAALRAAVEDLDDDEAVVTCLNAHPARYARLRPVIHHWARHYPVRPGVRRLIKPRSAQAKPSARQAPPGGRRNPQMARPSGAKPHKPPRKTAKAGPKRRGPGRR